MRRELRVRRKALETERAYAGWVSRFMKHGDSEDLRQFGEREIKSFLTQLFQLMYGAVYLPYALERKYPNEKREFGWQWLFPARQMSRDPRSGGGIM